MLQEVLKQRDVKLAEAQKAQAELIRKQRELDDAKRELDLTIEKRVQADLGSERDKAKKEAEEELKFKVMEKDQTITAMQRQIEELSDAPNKARNNFKEKFRNSNSKRCSPRNFPATRFSRCRKASSAATSCTASSAH